MDGNACHEVRKCPGMVWELGAVPWVGPIQEGEDGGTHPHCHCWDLHYPSPIPFPTGLGTPPHPHPQYRAIPQWGRPLSSHMQPQGEKPSPDNILGQNKLCVTGTCFAPGPTATFLSRAVAFHDKLFPSFHHHDHHSPLHTSPWLGMGSLLTQGSCHTAQHTEL